jgi:pimeloyl-ACP methyl ester carboxylesterase
MELTSQVRTPDGRVLEVHEGGDPAGPAVVAHHGTPAAGVLYGRDDALAAELGLRLIGYDRPGYGGSSRHRGRAVADAAADTLAILDALGIGRFATWGLSGGGPHALACAALARDRCVAATIVAGVAPYDAPGLDWTAGMGEDNVAEFAAAREGEEALAAYLEPGVPDLRDADPQELVAAMRSVLSDVDAAALAGGLGAYVAAATAHALVPGAGGWIDDDLAFAKPWGFALQAISVPVEIWQGQHDLMVPPDHGRWLADRVPGADFRFSPGDGHLSLLESQLPAIYAAMSRYTF